jgi:hypothetical protein
MKILRGESLDRLYLLKLFGFGVFINEQGETTAIEPWSGDTGQKDDANAV